MYVYNRESEPFIEKKFDELYCKDLDIYEKYYRLYEYTDDVCTLEDNTLYPGLLNYVKTGLLTKEELIDALEYNKDVKQ